MPALKVNIIIVHPWDVVFLRAIEWGGGGEGGEGVHKSGTYDYNL